MAGERILIADDVPADLKLARLLLAKEGYMAMAAASAEEALDSITSFHPCLVLAAVRPRGMDGLELARRIKRDEGAAGIAVIALTADAAPAGQSEAMEAGCDGCIAKPIDTRSLGSRIREFLDRRAERAGASRPSAQAAPSLPRRPAVPDAEMRPLRQRFLQEGAERLERLQADLDGVFPVGEAAKAAHQMVGTGGLLGYAEISRLAREVENILRERPLDNAQLRESLAELALAFSQSRADLGVGSP